MKPTKRRSSTFGGNGNNDPPEVMVYMQPNTNRQLVQVLDEPQTALMHRHDTEFITAGFNSFDQCPNPALDRPKLVAPQMSSVAIYHGQQVMPSKTPNRSDDS